MLTFHFRKEHAGQELILRLRLSVQLISPTGQTTSAALLDSGADRTIIPLFAANALKLKKGKPIETSGVGGFTEGYESVVDILFIDIIGATERVYDVPVYVLPNVHDIIIGRNKIFDEFKIIIEQYDNKVFLEKVH